MNHKRRKRRIRRQCSCGNPRCIEADTRTNLKLPARDRRKLQERILLAWPML